MELAELLNGVVAPNVSAFEDDPGSLRKGLNAVWSLDSLASHLFLEMREASLTHSAEDGNFKRKLAERNDDFWYVWDCSTASKHGVSVRASKFIKSSKELVVVAPDGALAYFSGLDAEEWGKLRIYVENDKFGIRPLDISVSRCFQFLELECRSFVSE